MGGDAVVPGVGGEGVGEAAPAPASRRLFAVWRTASFHKAVADPRIAVLPQLLLERSLYGSREEYPSGTPRPTMRRREKVKNGGGGGENKVGGALGEGPERYSPRAGALRPPVAYSPLRSHLPKNVPPWVPRSPLSPKTRARRRSFPTLHGFQLKD